MSVGVIGGGIAGLTTAYILNREGFQVRLLEASAETGGMIQTSSADGYLVEHGPNSLRDTTGILPELIQELGIHTERIGAASEARKRFVVKDGSPQALPTSPLSFLTTPLLSLRGKLRLLAEPFIRPWTSDTPESVASFIRRRLGREVLDYGVDPFIGGIFAGNAEDLSVKHAFSRLHDLEQEHGSLFRGMLHSVRSRNKKKSDSSDTLNANGSAASQASQGSRIYSFQDGLQTLPRALTDALGDRVRLRAPVNALRLDDQRWHVATQANDGSTEMHFFDAVVSTVPLHRLVGIDFPSNVDMSPLEDVPYPSVSVVALGFDRDDIRHPLDGFGMLVPKIERDFDILGTLFSSTLFPNRAPDGKALLTSFVGGARRPGLGLEETSVLRTMVLQDLRSLLGVEGDPEFVRHVQWARAIPQYTLHHGQVQDLITQIESRHPGLYLAGNYRSGISVGDAMQSGADTARRVMEWLSSVPA